MRISRKSPLTGKTNVMNLDITEAQFNELQSSGRRMIQEIVPNLSASEREFLLTGYTQEDWTKMFPPEQDEE